MRMWTVIFLGCLLGSGLTSPIAKKNMVIMDEEYAEERYGGNRKSEMAMTTLNLPSNATSIRADISDSFSCDNREYGYYADVENECQIFHVCLPVVYADGKENTFRWSFICPEETVFSQESFTCVRDGDLPFHCDESERFYELNRNFGMNTDTSMEMSAVEGSPEGVRTTAVDHQLVVAIGDPKKEIIGETEKQPAPITPIFRRKVPQRFAESQKKYQPSRTNVVEQKKTYAEIHAPEIVAPPNAYLKAVVYEPAVQVSETIEPEVKASALKQVVSEEPVMNAHLITLDIKPEMSTANPMEEKQTVSINMGSDMQMDASNAKLKTDIPEELMTDQKMPEVEAESMKQSEKFEQIPMEESTAAVINIDETSATRKEDSANEAEDVQPSMEASKTEAQDDSDQKIVMKEELKASVELDNIKTTEMVSPSDSDANSGDKMPVSDLPAEPLPKVETSAPVLSSFDTDKEEVFQTEMQKSELKLDPAMIAASNDDDQKDHIIQAISDIVKEESAGASEDQKQAETHQALSEEIPQIQLPAEPVMMQDMPMDDAMPEKSADKMEADVMQIEDKMESEQYEVPQKEMLPLEMHFATLKLPEEEMHQSSSLEDQTMDMSMLNEEQTKADEVLSTESAEVNLKKNVLSDEEIMVPVKILEELIDSEMVLKSFEEELAMQRAELFEKKEMNEVAEKSQENDAPPKMEAAEMDMDSNPESVMLTKTVEEEMPMKAEQVEKDLMEAIPSDQVVVNEQPLISMEDDKMKEGESSKLQMDKDDMMVTPVMMTKTVGLNEEANVDEKPLLHTEERIQIKPGEETPQMIMKNLVSESSDDKIEADMAAENSENTETHTLELDASKSEVAPMSEPLIDQTDKMADVEEGAMMHSIVEPVSNLLQSEKISVQENEIPVIVQYDDDMAKVPEAKIGHYLGNDGREGPHSSTRLIQTDMEEFLGSPVTRDAGSESSVHPKEETASTESQASNQEKVDATPQLRTTVDSTKSTAPVTVDTIPAEVLASRIESGRSLAEKMDPRKRRFLFRSEARGK